MGKLADWCKDQPAWVSDALRRAAVSDDISQADVDAVRARVAAAYELAVEGEHTCESFLEEMLRPPSPAYDDVLLCSIGPLNGVDRLTNDQQIKFALDGLTLIFGDNASGKSGYARAARQLCHARVAGRLRGDVYADASKCASIAVTYSHKRRGDAEAVTETWNEGDPRPPILSGITVLDTENARVYVEGENEILFLPAEVTCLTRLGKLYTLVGAAFQSEAEALSTANDGSFGALYKEDTSAGRLVRKLTTVTVKAQLPTEQQMRAAGEWSESLNKELSDLEGKLREAPSVVRGRLERQAIALESALKTTTDILTQVNDEAVGQVNGLLAEKVRTQGVADTFAAEQVGTQPLRGTGGESWKQLYSYAREFAAEVGIRPAGEAFEIGDPCALCQRPLDDEATARFAAFDAFIEGKANAEAAAAAEAVDERRKNIEQAPWKTDEEVRQLLAEYGSSSEEAQSQAADFITFVEHARHRRDALVRGLLGAEKGPIQPLPVSPADAMSRSLVRLKAEAQALVDGGNGESTIAQRATELADQKRLHEQLEEVLKRRGALEERLKILGCVAAVNTLPISRLATVIRKELVTPELSKRITQELARLSLSHIPLKFDEKTARGASFFEVALDAHQRADKEEVLSEGEQRALSIACFLADSHVAGRSAGIILDDPVTSLDHKRMRRVAERLVSEASAGRQIIVFTHNMLFYQEVSRACVDHEPQVPLQPCVVGKYGEGKFGLVRNGDEPWVAKKVKERERHLDQMINSIPDSLATDSEEFRQAAKTFYTDLRETWERAVEEVLLNAVVERFGTDVRTQSLKGVEVTDEDYQIVFRGMKKASEYSGHDRAAGRQLDPPSKEQMRKDLLELIGFRATRQKRRAALETERRKLEAPPAAQIA